MAIYVAMSTIYPTVGEVVAYFAVKSGLVSAHALIHNSVLVVGRVHFS